MNEEHYMFDEDIHLKYVLSVELVVLPTFMRRHIMKQIPYTYNSICRRLHI